MYACMDGYGVVRLVIGSLERLSGLWMQGGCSSLLLARFFSLEIAVGCGLVVDVGWYLRILAQGIVYY